MALSVGAMPRFTPALSNPLFFLLANSAQPRGPPPPTGNSSAGQPASPPTPPTPCLAGGGAAAAGSTHHAVSGGDDGLSVTSGHIYLFVFAALFVMAVLGAAAHCVVRHKGSQLAKLLERCSSGGERPSIEGGSVRVNHAASAVHRSCQCSPPAHLACPPDACDAVRLQPACISACTAYSCHQRPCATSFCRPVTRGSRARLPTAQSAGACRAARRVAAAGRSRGDGSWRGGSAPSRGAGGRRACGCVRGGQPRRRGEGRHGARSGPSSSSVKMRCEDALRAYRAISQQCCPYRNPSAPSLRRRCRAQCRRGQEPPRLGGGICGPGDPASTVSTTVCTGSRDWTTSSLSRQACFQRRVRPFAVGF